ncbi:unnamed protein product [Adineta steineri]|uniref:Uncharacterized protein n=1 Tax=Adineta steineri TaxID=433720 RepID=A0A813UP12_9BILA|nr:unnamed protein product [Adineta steineri]CAF1447646.1 unnamed protein product [Adineta steineri]
MIIHGSKMSKTEIKACYEKSKTLETGCDFIKCFHERYRCNDESVTAWAHELCQQFPKDIVLQFTPQGRQMMINVQNCTQDFLARTYNQRKSINCNAFESKYFSTLAKCYSKANDFCQVFKDNRALFMKQATTVMLKKPRALQAFAIAAKNCTRMITVE